AVALLKQKNPDWSPEEIKIAIKHTSTVLNLRFFEQGAGMLKILRTIALEEKPLVLNIDNENQAYSIIDIEGTVSGSKFDYYEVYYGSYYGLISESALNDGDVLICSGDQQIEKGILCNDFDTENINDGLYRITVKAYTTEGEYFTNNGLIDINNFQISKNNRHYFNGKESINILGQIRNSNYDRYKISYFDRIQNEVVELCNEERPSNDILCSVNLNNLDNGKYELKLSILKNGIWINDDVVFDLLIINELKDNWPIQLGCGSNLPPVVGNIYNNEENKFLIVSPADCSFQGNSGGLFGSNLTIFNGDGNYHSLEFDYIERSPTILDQSIAIIDNRDVGIIQSSGEFKNGWPKEIYGYQLDTILAVKNNLFFRTYSPFNRDFIHLEGFDLNGNTLPNFPVTVQNDPGFDIWFSNTQLILLNNGTNMNLGFIFGNSNTSSFETNLYFYTYSLEGEFLGRSHIYSSKPEEKIMMTSFTNLVAGDLDNDNLSEIGFGFLALDLRKFDLNMYDLDAYQGYLININGNGNISENLIKGYSPSLLAIGKIKGDNPEFIYAMSDTHPTTYLGQKVVGVNYSNGIDLDFNLDNDNNIIGGMSIGDLGYGQSSILLTHRPRWWGGASSGILIYDGNGVKKHEIEIPTYGLAEQVGWQDNPTLSDIDSDGKIDIIQPTLHLLDEFGTIFWKSHIFVFNTNKEVIGELDWPQFQHDPQHTGCYDCENEEEIICEEDKDCDDLNDDTVDTCINPGTVESYCRNEGGSGKTCTDSDGFDITTLGNVNYDGAVYNDQCLGEKEIIEYTCAITGWFSSEKEVKANNRECQYSCVDGKCVDQDKNVQRVCSDNDVSNKLDVYGAVLFKGDTYEDTCVESGLSVKQYFCVDDKLRNFVKRCANGMRCISGSCQ
ncbi:MAG: hypothetical protein AABX35_01310, partial [Nanoarchaeota archaeon]